MTIKWTEKNIRHLLNRAAFGAHPEELEQARRIKPETYIDQLLSGSTRKLPVPEWWSELIKVDRFDMRRMDKEERQRFRQKLRQYTNQMLVAWTGYIAESPTIADCVHQKLTFFWHGHFATSVQKVQNPVAIYEQIALFNRFAIGNYGELLHQIIRDGAMINYLDNNRNNKRKPNENLARELMELFSLGPGNYKEIDIKEGARALTGYRYENGAFIFDQRQHDFGEKSILGKSGPFTGADFVDIILSQKACAEFMVRKIWQFYVGDISEKLCKQFADIFRKNKYEIKPLLKAMFLHKAFYDKAIMGKKIKSPLELVMGSSHLLRLEVPSDLLYAGMMRQMGQTPYMPPNVKGWPGGRNWIDTTRLISRYTFAELIARQTIPREMRNMMRGMKMRMAKNPKLTYDPAHLFTKTKASGAFKEIEDIFLILPVEEKQRSEMLGEFTKEFKDNKSEAVRQLIGKLMLLPQFQLI